MLVVHVVNILGCENIRVSNKHFKFPKFPYVCLYFEPTVYYSGCNYRLVASPVYLT